MIFTAWGTEGFADTLVAGDEAPKFADGSLQEPDAELIFTIEASDWDEAMRQFDALRNLADA